MKKFVDALWGYELTYPEHWIHRTIGDTQGFSAIPDGLTPGYQGEKNGHLLVRAEWNGLLKPLEPLWNQHIGLSAGLLGAKKVGAAPWSMGGAHGMEAEIALPKTGQQRLWAGILGKGPIVLHFMVSHALEERAWFEPVVTQLITSLRFSTALGSRVSDREDFPIPSGYSACSPGEIISDIANPAQWQAYCGKSQVGALQAYYLRELPSCGWEIDNFEPFPGLTALGFARFQAHRGEDEIILGLMPYGGERVHSSSPANIVIKQAIR
jgi:hypothetical protein